MTLKTASIYEGGHRVPMLIWWPLGTDPALQGTNYDLPVSQTDFFATFAEVLNYPLPGGEKCTYSYDSSSKSISKSKMRDLGRPIRPNWGNSNTYKSFLTGLRSPEGFTSDVELKNSQGFRPVDNYLRILDEI